MSTPQRERSFNPNHDLSRFEPSEGAQISKQIRGEMGRLRSEPREDDSSVYPASSRQWPRSGHVGIVVIMACCLSTPLRSGWEASDPGAPRKKPKTWTSKVVRRFVVWLILGDNTEPTVNRVYKRQPQFFVMFLLCYNIKYTLRILQIQ